ncbi:MAG: hypothetical protein SGI84_13920 [Gemmatimonadota bacterium]|nr:hypothetical protein [Gemmatimonadota bacterium]
MTLLFALQAAPAGWVGTTVALAMVVIAICFIGMAFAGFQIQRDGAELRKDLHALTSELEPTIKAVNRLAVKGEALSEQISGEVREVLETSRRTRFTFERGIKRARRRLQDFDALIEVVQEEVEETALDASAAMRRVRTAGGAIGFVRKLLVRGRR